MFDWSGDAAGIKVRKRGETIAERTPAVMTHSHLVEVWKLIRLREKNTLTLRRCPLLRPICPTNEWEDIFQTTVERKRVCNYTTTYKRRPLFFCSYSHVADSVICCERSTHVLCCCRRGPLCPLLFICFPDCEAPSALIVECLHLWRGAQRHCLVRDAAFMLWFLDCSATGFTHRTLLKMI